MSTHLDPHRLIPLPFVGHLLKMMTRTFSIDEPAWTAIWNHPQKFIAITLLCYCLPNTPVTSELIRDLYDLCYYLVIPINFTVIIFEEGVQLHCHRHYLVLRFGVTPQEPSPEPLQLQGSPLPFQYHFAWTTDHHWCRFDHLHLQSAGFHRLLLLRHVTT